MFRRRQKPKFLIRIRHLVWPSMGFGRLFRYCSLRIVRLAHDPAPLARAIACGVTVSFFPLFGVHAFMGMAMAMAMKANPLVAAAATLLMPPVILPLVFSLDFIVGRKILRYFGFYTSGSEEAFIHHAHQGIDLTAHADAIVPHFTQLYLPALTGALLFMLLVWPATYMAAHRLIAFLERRHELHKAQRAERRTKGGAA